MRCSLLYPLTLDTPCDTTRQYHSSSSRKVNLHRSSLPSPKSAWLASPCEEHEENAPCKGSQSSTWNGRGVLVAHRPWGCKFWQATRSHKADAAWSCWPLQRRRSRHGHGAMIGERQSSRRQRHAWQLNMMIEFAPCKGPSGGCRFPRPLPAKRPPCRMLS
jgi:hypothetical protein